MKSDPFQMMESKEYNLPQSVSANQKNVDTACIYCEI